MLGVYFFFIRLGQVKIFCIGHNNFSIDLDIIFLGSNNRYSLLWPIQK
jgi:hypothetical protein